MHNITLQPKHKSIAVGLRWLASDKNKQGY